MKNQKSSPGKDFAEISVRKERVRKLLASWPRAGINADIPSPHSPFLPELLGTLLPSGAPATSCICRQPQDTA